MSEIHIDEHLAYQEERDYSDVENSVQKDSAGEENSNSSNIVDEEEEEFEGSEEEDDEGDTETEGYDSDDKSSDNWEDNWEDNPHLEFIDINHINPHEIIWYSDSQEEQECNIDSFEDFFFSLNGIRSMNDFGECNGVNESGNRFVMLGDSLASGGAYEYYNTDGSYYSQRADGSIVRRDKYGREHVTPSERNPRMGRRYQPY